jgi:hypothetical protein
MFASTNVWFDQCPLRPMFALTNVRPTFFLNYIVKLK